MTPLGAAVLLLHATSTFCPDGVWVGSWTLPEQPSHDLVLTLARSESNEFTGMVVSVSGGLGGEPLQDGVLRGNVAKFTIDDAHFRGSYDAGCQFMAGTIRRGEASGLGVFHVVRRPAIRGNPAAMTYQGTVPMSEAHTIDLAVHLLSQDGQWLAEVDLSGAEGSALRAYPVAVRTDAASDGVLLLEYPTGPGREPVSLAFEPAGSSVTALWTRGRTQHLINLTRAGSPLQRLEALGEPTLTARLVIPETDAPHPLVLLVGEAGTDLDGTVNGTPVLAALADSLGERGFATLRLHMQDGTFQDRRRAVRRWMEWIVANDAFDARKLAVLGHGEGASIALRHAATFGDDVAAVAIVSAPGMSGRLLVEDRIEKSGGDFEPALAAWRTFVDYAMHDSHEEAIRIGAAAWIPHRQQQFDGERLPMDAAIDHAVQLAMDPSWRYRMGNDPRMELARVRGMPVLAMQGDHSQSFDGPRNLTALSETADSRGVSFEPRLLPGLDHALASGASGEMDLAAREAITQWLAEQLQLNPPNVSP